MVSLVFYLGKRRGSPKISNKPFFPIRLSTTKIFQFKQLCFSLIISDTTQVAFPVSQVLLIWFLSIFFLQKMKISNLIVHSGRIQMLTILSLFYGFFFNLVILLFGFPNIIFVLHLRLSKMCNSTFFTSLA